MDTDLPFELGRNYLFRTIGYHWLGRVIAFRGKFVVLDDASWIADTGRYGECLKGNLVQISSSEIEPSPRQVVINSDHITDAVEYPFVLPRDAK